MLTELQQQASNLARDGHNLVFAHFAHFAKIAHCRKVYHCMTSLVWTFERQFSFMFSLFCIYEIIDIRVEMKACLGHCQCKQYLVNQSDDSYHSMKSTEVNRMLLSGIGSFFPVISSERQLNVQFNLIDKKTVLCRWHCCFHREQYVFCGIWLY